MLTRRDLFLIAGLLAVGLTTEGRADLISHWTMDGHLDDETGSGNDGTFVGEIEPFFEDGHDGTLGGALTLDGIDDYVDIPQQGGFPISSTPAFSIAMWVKGAPQDDRRIFSETSSVSNAPLYTLETEEDGATGQFDFIVRDDANVTVVAHAKSTGIVFDSTWHHVAWVDDNGQTALYIDGVRDPMVLNYTRPVLTMDVTTLGAVVREAGANVCCLFQGAIDDVRIYDHALTEGEVEDLVPDSGCPLDGDTHCDDLQVFGPLDDSPGTYTISVLGAFDDSADPIQYTFTATEAGGEILQVGPQLENSADLLLQEGTWDIEVETDDNLNCDDEAVDAICFTQVVITCPEEGDTHCDDLQVIGPPEDVPGIYQVSVLGATDDSGEPVLYTFTAESDAGEFFQLGPQQDINPSAFMLHEGVWTISVLVDDNTLCADEAPDAICTTQITVESVEPRLVSHWPFDGDTADAEGTNDGVFQGDIEPNYVAGFDGTPGGAIEFDGIDDLVVVTHDDGLPLYPHSAFTVAMWVRGGPQPDFRVWSESFSDPTITNPLFNIGTDNTGNTGSADLYIRPSFGGGGLPHTHSERAAFDMEWHHIAFVDDGGKAVLYIDGVRDATDFTYSKGQLITDTTTIGGILRDVPSHWFQGAIDDVRAYNYALSAEEVLALVPEPESCDEQGDTHCDDLVIDSPEDGYEGVHLFSVQGAADDSGDPVLYMFVLKNEAEGLYLQKGPGPDNFAEFYLSSGAWTVEVIVDDVILCRDEAADNTCSQDLVVEKEPEVLISHWRFDGDVLDYGTAGNDGIFEGDLDPSFDNGYDDTPEGALSLDGLDDYVIVPHNEGLPLMYRRRFTIAMWVKGLPQPDMRIWSESSTLNRTPLFNLGTENTGTTSAFDFFLRDNNNTIVNHRHSVTPVFDGEWHHIAWTDDNGQVVLYVDGFPDATDFSYPRPTPVEMEVETTTIGGILRDTPSNWFDGAIDDVRIYNYVLSEEEVNEVMDGGGGPDEPLFHRGDSDGNGAVNITDGIYILNFLFLGGPGPGCEESADADDNGAVNITDGIYVLNFLFLGGPAPPAPGPDSAPCGPDPAGSPELPCDVYTPCNP